MNQTLNTESLMQISLFQKITKAKVKDCFEDSFKQLIFCVYPGELHKAIGKNGSTIKRLDVMFKRKLRVIEFADKVEKFVENLCYPYKIEEVSYATEALWDETKKIVRVTPLDTKSRGYLIGKAGVNLRNIEKICKRYYNVDEIKIGPAKDVSEVKVKTAPTTVESYIQSKDDDVSFDTQTLHDDDI